MRYAIFSLFLVKPTLLHRRPTASLWLAVVLAMAISPRMGWAKDVSLSLLTIEEGKPIALESRQALWKSPYGGWALSGWPYTMSVGRTPLFVYQTADEQLSVKLDPTAKKPSSADDLLNDIKGQPNKPGPGATIGSQAPRRSMVSLDLPPGRHVIDPFGIEFTVGADGTLTSKDSRVRVDAKEGRIEILCHSVTIKQFVNNQSVHGPLRLLCGTTALLGGLEKQIAENEKRQVGTLELADGKGLRRATIYLPASAPQRPYEVNGIRFEVREDGSLTLAKSEQARIVDREIHLLASQPVAAVRPVGVRWYGGNDKSILSNKAKTVQADGDGSTWLPVDGDRSLRLGLESVHLPESDARWPHEMVLWEVSASAAWCVAASPLATTPGATWSCRVTSLTRTSPACPSTLTVRLEDAASAENGGEFVLQAGGNGTLAGTLPAKAGLWKLTVAPGSPWQGRPLGLVRIAAKPTTHAVSLYTNQNRGLARRGDSVPLFWSVIRLSRSAATWPIVIRGEHLETKIGQISLPARGKEQGESKLLSGSFSLDTSALAPGEYTISVNAEEIAAYPVRLRICQREPVSDFELYAHVYNDAKPYAGSPVTGYYGKIPGGPGLDPFLADGDAAMAPHLAAYSEAPAGPVLEKFLQPTAEDLKSMALTRLGMRAVPAYPSMLHHEDWNPKHTLPQDLAQLRRRLALFAQPRVDVPGFSGVSLGWFATLGGYWEESPPLDGHQKQRNAAANQWVTSRVATEMLKLADINLTDEQRKRQESLVALRARSSILPNAFGEYLADVRQMAPGLTSHNAIPSFWQGNAQSYPPSAYSTLSHRDAVDYTDYCLPPWGNFRAPAFLAMHNPLRQKLHCEFFTHNSRSEQFATAFGAAGRGLDGFSMSQGHEDLLRIFQRYGSWFSAYEPLPDVAVYFSGWANQASVVLHDLARMRRPGMLLSSEDVLAGALPRYKVLFLAGIGPGESPEVIAAFREFEKKGGLIIKDAHCHASLPGRTLSFAYDKEHVHNGWGLAYPNGEWEFAHLWKHFHETREQPLIEAFAKAPRIPVATPSADVVLSPLAGKESILCFVINQTLVPLEVEGRWRQMFVLPRTGELLVEQGWHVHDVLSGAAAVTKPGSTGSTVPVDFTRAEGALYLLTRREPKSMSIGAKRTSATNLRLNGWLADAKGEPLADPMPFEVTLTTREGKRLYHKFATLAPNLSLDVPIPASSTGESLTITVRDLILGSVATHAVAPAEPATVATQGDADFVGGAAPVAAFLAQRRGPVTVLLDEGQEAFRPAAEKLADLLRASGRAAKVEGFRPDEVRPLPLRWKPLPEDLDLVERLRDGKAFASRVGLRAVSRTDLKTGRSSLVFDDPKCGYDEYGPRLRHDADIVLFGTPATHRALSELTPYLRRVPSKVQPVAGGYFVHYLWSPFQGGYDGLYIGCHDAEGAQNAVARLHQLKPLASSAESTVKPEPEASITISRGGPSTPLEPLITGKFGTAVQNVAFAPDGTRLFVTTAAMGDSLFALSPDGTVQEHRSRYIGRKNFWAPYDGSLEAIDSQTVHVGVGGTLYRYSFEKGWVSRIPAPPTGLVGPHAIKIGASTVLKDTVGHRTFLGGARKVHAMDSQGRLLWVYDDAAMHTSAEDLLYPRSLFPRGLSTDGRVLLVSGFGIKHDTYGRGATVNRSVFGLDAATGKLLWERKDWLLNQGKVIPMANRFLVADDAGETQILIADRGQTISRLPTVEAADWMLPVAGSNSLLFVENNGFDRQGPASRVYLRSWNGGPDKSVPVVGRVTDVIVAPDGQSITCVSARGITERYSAGGQRLWQTETPSGGIVRLSPDGQTVLVGGRDGRLHWLNSADGQRVRTVDFNPYNSVTPDQFVRQLDSVGDLPLDASLSAPPAPPEPSYLTTLQGKAVKFGPNLVVADQLRQATLSGPPDANQAGPAAAAGRLRPDSRFTVTVEAGRTYLVELLASAAEPRELAPQTRLEVSIVGQRKTSQLPFIARLPLNRDLTRQRLAFRADEAGSVTLTFRAVEPRTVQGGKKSEMTYQEATASRTGLLVSELVVAAMNFGGRNLVYDSNARGMLERDAAKSPVTPSGAGASVAEARRPVGEMSSLVYPWTGGNSTVRHAPYPCPLTSLRLADGVLGNQETVWTQAVRGTGIDHAECRVRFQQPQEVRSIAVYEDNSGPIAEPNGVKERITPRFAVYVRDATTKQWHPVGVVLDNRQLVNIFACPARKIDEIHYLWASRNDAARTDGFVRLAELEVYSADELSGVLGNDLDDLLQDKPPPKGGKK
ncbi:MAG: hypothetical protein EXS09_19415 [Gemmataceae bacterium]|nr:hypothetical protein [Gemmataceae bacterium]